MEMLPELGSATFLMCSCVYCIYTIWQRKENLSLL